MTFFTIRCLALAILVSLLTLTGCNTVERYQAMQTATTAPASITVDQMELAIDAYIWRDENANEAEGYLQAWIVLFDRNQQAIHPTYRLVECQVIRPDRMGIGPIAGSIGRYPVGAGQNVDQVQIMTPPPIDGALCLGLKHDLATTGLSPNYDLALVLEKVDTKQRWTIRTKNQPVHRLTPPTDWFQQATTMTDRQPAANGQKP